MKDGAEAALLRRDLDEIPKKWRRVPAEPPKGGWVRALRTALGMTAQDLGQRMKMSQAAVAALEQSEARDAAQLSTLRRAAKALDCALVYALMPRYPLDRMIEKRRRWVALGELAGIAPEIMIAQRDYKDLIDAYAQKIRRNRLWRAPVVRTGAPGSGGADEKKN